MTGGRLAFLKFIGIKGIRRGMWLVRICVDASFHGWGVCKIGNSEGQLKCEGRRVKMARVLGIVFAYD